MGWSLASTLAKLKRCHQMPMPIPWGDHLDLARCVEATGELDLGAAAVVMGGALHILQRDLLVASWEPQRIFNGTPLAGISSSGLSPRQ